MTDKEQQGKNVEEPVLEWTKFLEEHPPGTLTRIRNLYSEYGSYHYRLLAPEIQLYCDHEDCGGMRYFDIISEDLPTTSFPALQTVFLIYACRHCKENQKIIALIVFKNENDLGGTAAKLGEWPPFGPHIPPKVISMIGTDRDLFLKGLRCESQSLGIAAFAYYRRVVENQKSKLIDEVIRASKKLAADEQIIKTLEKANKETRFSKAVSIIKDAVPEVIKINGHNPLTLLHQALSKGIHAQSDEACLALATSIRVVLAEMAGRLQLALKEKKELEEAVSRLMKND